MNIPFSPPDITQEDIDEVVDTLRSGWITTGPKTKEFERQVASYCSTPRAVCFNSATAAMELCLRLLGVGPGDEVITSAYTYTASASVIYHIGAKIVLVDTAADSYFFDYQALEGAITERTKVIIPVDIGGVMADYAKIFAIVEAKQSIFVASSALQEVFGRIIVLADAAHSFGGEQLIQDDIRSAPTVYKSGSVADFTAFSFHAVKNLTTAEGGALTWRALPGFDNEMLYKKLVLFSLHGQSKDALAKNLPGAWEYNIEFPGYKCNMTDIQASLGLSQLRRYEQTLEKRQKIIDIYDSVLSDAPITSLSHNGEFFHSSRHLYLTRVIGADIEMRNAIINNMSEKHIAVNVHFKPIPMHTAYKKLGFDIADFPHSYRQYENGITLPVYSALTDEMVLFAATEFRKTLDLFLE